MPRVSPTVWLFDPDAMQLGDVVLERGSGIGSAFVAEVTNGHYSHALIWVGGGDFIEAMPDGTRSISFVRVPVVTRQDWRLLRVAPESQTAATKAAEVARTLAFNSYDKDGAIRSVIAPRSQPKTSHRFCSQLVAEAYEAANLPLFENGAPGSVYPNLLLQSARLNETPLPLIPANSITGSPYPPDMLDRSGAFRGTPMDEEGDIARAIFAEVSPLIDGESLPPPLNGLPIGVLNDVLSVLPYLPPETAQKIADRLLQEMDTLGYFHLLVPQIAKIWFSLEPSPWWKYRSAIWREASVRHRINSDRCLEAGKLMPHSMWLKLRAMYTMNAMAFDALLEKVGEEA